VYSINAQQQSTCLHNPNGSRSGTQGTTVMVTMDQNGGQNASSKEQYCVSIQIMAEGAYLGWPFPMPKLLTSLAHTGRRLLRHTWLGSV
jgi:hypothetical protein